MIQFFFKTSECQEFVETCSGLVMGCSGGSQFTTVATCKVLRLRMAYNELVCAAVQDVITWRQKAASVNQVF